MPVPFRVRDGDDPGRDLGGWDENGNIDLPGTLTVDTITTRNLSMAGDSAATGDLSVQGRALGTVQPADHNLVAWAYDPISATTGSTLTAGTLYLSGMFVPADVTVTKIYWHVSTVAVTPTAGQNEIGLYSAAGVRLASANTDAVITSTGLKSTTIAATTLTGGAMYWVAQVCNAATPYTTVRATGVTAAGELINVGLTAPTYRFATNATGQATLPATITPANNVQVGISAGPWAAIGV